LGIRITIVIDEDLHGKLRDLQAKQIKEKKAAISFSQVLNESIRRGIKEKKVKS